MAAVYAPGRRHRATSAAKTALTRRSAWSNRVEPHWGNTAVVDVKTSAVRAWVAKMAADEVGAATIENAFGLLRRVLGAAVEDSRIPRNPCDGVRLPKREHADRGYLTHAQVAALAGAVKRHSEVVRFLAYTGLRWGEMAALRVGTSTCCAAGSTCPGRSPRRAGWCGARRRRTSAGRCRSRRRWLTSWRR